MSLKVTVVDEQTGESETQRVADGDYVCIVAAPADISHVQVMGATGRTHQLTIKRDPRPLGPETRRLTHGRHCSCTACRNEDWTRPELTPRCGFHGETACPKVYAPLGGAGDMVPA